MHELAHYIKYPKLEAKTRRFLHQQLNPDANDNAPLCETPDISSRIFVYHSATTTLFAPSDPAGIDGVRRERVRATPSWRKGDDTVARYDCILVETDPQYSGMRAMHAARVKLFFSFWHNGVTYPCALVEWFVRVSDEPDEDTGMWMVQPEFDEFGD